MEILELKNTIRKVHEDSTEYLNWKMKEFANFRMD